MATKTESKIFYLSSFDSSDHKYASILNQNNPVGKGADSSVACSIAMGTTASAEAYAYWFFDVSAIPKKAAIDSVSCKAKGLVTFTSRVSIAEFQLFAGSVAKGSATSFRSSTATAYILTPGSWTREELDSIRLRVYGEKNTSTSAVAMSFYGAELSVTYTYQSEKFMLKLSGDYKDIARTFKKANDIWVEQTDLANVIEDGVRYQNGGEIESTGPALITFTIDGTSYQAEEGMTWIEWVDSDYNPGDYSIATVGSYKYVEGPGGGFLLYQSDVVYATTAIVSGGSYVSN